MGNYVSTKAEIKDYICARTPLVVVDSPECSEFVPTLVEGKYYYDLGINTEKYEDKQGHVNISGYEIYEKNGTTYTKLDGGELHNPEVIGVAVKPGESKKYVARVYAAKSDGEKLYSDYSNEIVINHLIVDVPELATPEVGSGYYVLDINYNGESYSGFAGKSYCPSNSS